MLPPVTDHVYAVAPVTAEEVYDCVDAHTPFKTPEILAGRAGVDVATPLQLVALVAQELLAFTQTLPEENPEATFMLMALVP